MFVSGVTCALAYGNVQRTDGWPAVISHTIPSQLGRSTQAF